MQRANCTVKLLLFCANVVVLLSLHVVVEDPIDVVVIVGLHLPAGMVAAAEANAVLLVLTAPPLPRPPFLLLPFWCTLGM